MGRGRVTPDETIERIKATYAMNGNLRQTARVLGVPVATVSKYVDPDLKDGFEHVRAEKRLTIIEQIANAQAKLIEAMVDPEKLAKSSLHDIGVAFGIVTDKGLLLSGQATSITGTVDPSAKLTPEEMEQAARIREKAAASAVPS